MKFLWLKNYFCLLGTCKYWVYRCKMCELNTGCNRSTLIRCPIVSDYTTCTLFEYHGSVEGDALLNKLLNWQNVRSVEGTVHERRILPVELKVIGSCMYVCLVKKTIGW